MQHYEKINYITNNKDHNDSKLEYKMDYKVFLFIIKLYDYLNNDDKFI